MNSKQIQLIQESWLRVGPGAVASFYDNLFTIRPSLRAMFPDDLAGQRKKLQQMLGMVVRGLRKLDALVPAAQELGRRHVNYGVLPGHYKVVGQALIQTLADSLGEHWTDDVAQAWLAAYTLLSETMIEAAEAQRRGHGRRRRLSTNGDVY